MKTKIFYGTWMPILEREINEFIGSNNIEIKQILQSYYEKKCKDNYRNWMEQGVTISIFYVDSE